MEYIVCDIQYGVYLEVVLWTAWRLDPWIFLAQSHDDQIHFIQLHATHGVLHRGLPSPF